MFASPAGTEADFYRRWLAAQPGYSGAPSAVAVNVDGVYRQVSPPGGTGIIVSCVALRNIIGNAGTLVIRSGSGGGAIVCSLTAGQDRAISWVDPGSLWYAVLSAGSDVSSGYEISWGA